jgi:hypothetical protein
MDPTFLDLKKLNKIKMKICTDLLKFRSSTDHFIHCGLRVKIYWAVVLWSLHLLMADDALCVIDKRITFIFPIVVKK